MIDRRMLFSAAAAFASFASWALGTGKASAKEDDSVSSAASAATNTQERLPSADADGLMDFHAGSK